MSTYQQALKLAANTYQQKIELLPNMFPLPEELHISVWQSYARAAEEEGAFQVLSERLPQFWFPVQKGVSETADYRAALGWGVARAWLPGASGLRLARAGELTLRVYTGSVCSVPVLYPRGKDDFLTLFRALAMRHEPVEVAEAVGAVMISGFNNWDRVHALRRSFEESQSREGSWEEEFRRIRQCKELYQDRLLILSDGSYAGLLAGQMGMNEDVWLKISLKLRLGHECMHVPNGF